MFDIRFNLIFFEIFRNFRFDSLTQVIVISNKPFNQGNSNSSWNIIVIYFEHGLVRELQSQKRFTYERNDEGTECSLCPFAKVNYMHSTTVEFTYSEKVA